MNEKIEEKNFEEGGLVVEEKNREEEVEVEEGNGVEEIHEENEGKLKEEEEVEESIEDSSVASGSTEEEITSIVGVDNANAVTSSTVVEDSDSSAITGISYNIDGTVLFLKRMIICDFEN